MGGVAIVQVDLQNHPAVHCDDVDDYAKKMPDGGDQNRDDDAESLLEERYRAVLLIGAERYRNQCVANYYQEADYKRK